MDVYCPRCGEPYDATSRVTRDPAFRAGRGCSTKCANNAPAPNDMRALASGTLMEMYGDDIDGVASDLDDFAALGML